MKNFKLFFVVAVLFVVSANGYALGEKVLKLGGENGWKAVKTRLNITEIEKVRPHPVLALSSAIKNDDPSLDMSLSFDEAEAALFSDKTGRYIVTASGMVYAARGNSARLGKGAALFYGSQTASYSPEINEGGPVNIKAKPAGALFSAGRNLGSWSIEFWLYPAVMESGEEIVTWNAVIRKHGSANSAQNYQWIKFSVMRSKMVWDFSNFFTSPNNDQSANIRLTSVDSLVPRKWSHHLLRFDGDSGLLEYLINGELQDVAFATPTGTEDKEVWTPTVGERGGFVLGKYFNGMIDDFHIFDKYVVDAKTNRYPVSGGRFETEPLDLGSGNNTVTKIEIAGGRVNPSGTSAGNEFARNGIFRFSDNSQVEFFVRAFDSKYETGEDNWQIFKAGMPLDEIKGRFVQFAAVLYPSGDAETTPYLDEVQIIWTSKAAPLPPENVTAIAGDGSVEVKWKPRLKNENVGYMVYYGKASGEYFGDEALGGPSPVDAGKQVSLTIDNLKNGTLYYFAVCAYDIAAPFDTGDFSREAAGRPLKENSSRRTANK
ncbi:hypothetical protein FACS189494_03060 [Spirochaetia bacterium]|nr:hypothetical protein FACS189494_03060 [Spirochaetia bacterium]